MVDMQNIWEIEYREETINTEYTGKAAEKYKDDTEDTDGVKEMESIGNLAEIQNFDDQEDMKKMKNIRTLTPPLTNGG